MYTLDLIYKYFQNMFFNKIHYAYNLFYVCIFQLYGKAPRISHHRLLHKSLRYWQRSVQHSLNSLKKPQPSSDNFSWRLATSQPSFSLENTPWLCSAMWWLSFSCSCLEANALSTRRPSNRSPNEPSPPTRKCDMSERDVNILDDRSITYVDFELQ